jgi:hypothetical protein
MVENPFTEPSNAELLKRIHRLENENAELQRAIDRVWKSLDMRLKGDVVDLRLKIIPLEDRYAELKEDLALFKLQTEDSLIELNEFLGGLIGKMLPNFYNVLDKVRAIVPPRRVDPRISRKLDERQQ